MVEGRAGELLGELLGSGRVLELLDELVEGGKAVELLGEMVDGGRRGTGGGIRTSSSWGRS